MHKRPPTPSADEAFLVDVSTEARRYGRLLMSRDDANDIAQDIVREFLIKLREGGCVFDVDAIVKTLEAGKKALAATARRG